MSWSFYRPFRVYHTYTRNNPQIPHPHVQLDVNSMYADMQIMGTAYNCHILSQYRYSQVTTLNLYSQVNVMVCGKVYYTYSKIVWTGQR